MAISARPAGPHTDLPPLPIHRFTVAQYHRMAAIGVLGDEDPVELLDGLIVVKGNSTLVPAITVVNGAGGPSCPLRVRRFTVDEYHALIRDGILSEDDPVELLEGWIVRKMSRNPPHDVALALVLKALGVALPPGWHSRVQSAVTTDVSEPEPDVAVVRGAERDYLQGHPRPRDTALVAEVADSSLPADRAFKCPLYARVGIPVFWIVSIPDERVEVYTDPTGPDPDPSYRRRQDYGINDAVPLVLNGQQAALIPARDLLP